MQNSGIGAEQRHVRHVGDRTLVAAHTIPALPGRPAVNIERNGRGDQYTTLRYTIPGVGGESSRRRFLYLGRLTEAELKLLVMQCERHQNRSGRGRKSLVYAPSIGQLNAQRIHALAAARRRAEACGLYMQGHELRRRRDDAGGRSFEHASEDDLLELTAALQELHWCLDCIKSAYTISQLCMAAGIAVQLDRGGRPCYLRDLKRAVGAAQAATKASLKVGEAFKWTLAAWHKTRSAKPL